MAKGLKKDQSSKILFVNDYGDHPIFLGTITSLS